MTFIGVSLYSKGPIPFDSNGNSHHSEVLVIVLSDGNGVVVGSIV